MNKKWIWTPNVCLNDLYFDKPYLKYDEFVLDKKQIELEKELFDDNYVEFQDIERNLFSFYGSNRIFDSAEIVNNLYYKETNIIGLSINNLQNILPINDLIYNTEYNSYLSDSFGVIFWIDNNKIESVSIYKSYVSTYYSKK